MGTDTNGSGDQQERNIISANLGSGISITGLGTNANIVAGNFIGTDAFAITPLGNADNGMHIIDGADNRIGGSVDAANRIAFNAGIGVRIEGATATGNRIQANPIYANGGLGIDLAGDGVTLNDANDADAGPNLLQNFPVIDLAYSAGRARVEGQLESAPNSTFSVDFFAGAERDPMGYGEGRRYLGSTTATTDASGRATFQVVLLAPTFNGDYVTATATDSAGNSSEFSRAVRVIDNLQPTIDPKDIVVTVIEDEYDHSAGFGIPTTSILEGDTIRLDGLFSNADEDDVHRVEIDWGDGSPVTTIAGIPAGVRGFTAEHIYVDDNPSNTPADDYTIHVVVIDDEYTSGEASVVMNVANVAPLAELTLDQDEIQEGQSVLLTGNVVDPGSGELFTVSINWGDGTPSEPFLLPPGETQFTRAHGTARTAGMAFT